MWFDLCVVLCFGGYVRVLSLYSSVSFPGHMQTLFKTNSSDDGTQKYTQRNSRKAALQRWTHLFCICKTFFLSIYVFMFLVFLNVFVAKTMSLNDPVTIKTYFIWIHIFSFNFITLLWEYIDLWNSRTLPTFALPPQKWICFKSSMRFLVRSARQRGEWCSGSSKKEKVKLREKLRLVTGCRGGSRGGRRWENPRRLTCDPSSSPPAETDMKVAAKTSCSFTDTKVVHDHATISWIIFFIKFGSKCAGHCVIVTCGILKHGIA